ncbi:MAG TPA: STAS domain-containing protein [Jatrophihabitans sp.]|jgi:anti-anti-sigma factor
MEPVRSAAFNATVGRDPDGTPVLGLHGELDIATAASAGLALDTVPPPTKLVVDVSELSFMDSSGLAVLLGARNRGYDLRLRRPSTIVRDLIAATGLNEILPFES